MSEKKSIKKQREEQVLLGLVDLFLKEGKPIGSNTLKESGFQNLSSATIRNYFGKLEKEDFLKQQHSSGGRTPTSKAFKLYAEHHYLSDTLGDQEKEHIKKTFVKETQEVARFLQEAAEALSKWTQCAVIYSAPRFDQDLITDVKLMALDHNRCLAVMVTEFGLVHTEILYTPSKLSSFSLRRIEAYFHFRMTGLDEPKLNKDEEKIASKFYNEVFLRHVVGFTNFHHDDLYKTGFSEMLSYPEMRDATALANGLSLFENSKLMRTLLNQCAEENKLRFWIGDDLISTPSASRNSAVIAIPYAINGKPVGTFALLGPTRIPYSKIFALLRAFSHAVGESLTKSLYKFKITYRKPQTEAIDLQNDHPSYAEGAHFMLLEDKTYG